MAFRDFTAGNIRERLGLTFRDGVLFPDPPSAEVRPEFASFLNYGLDLAVAINTEKARSEFAIAPILLELRRTTGDQFQIFSGVEWSVEPARGLNGYCDFLLTWGATRHILTAPFAVVVEAKNDPLMSGLGQCMAAMYAAVLANRAEGTPDFPVYGTVTSGGSWKFLRIDDTQVTIDQGFYSTHDLPQLMGVLEFITRRPAALVAA